MGSWYYVVKELGRGGGGDVESRGGGGRGVLPIISSIHMQFIIFSQKLTSRLAVFFYYF